MIKLIYHNNIRSTNNTNDDNDNNNDDEDEVFVLGASAHVLKAS